MLHTSFYFCLCQPLAIINYTKLAHFVTVVNCLVQQHLRLFAELSGKRVPINYGMLLLDANHQTLDTGQPTVSL